MFQFIKRFIVGAFVFAIGLMATLSLKAPRPKDLDQISGTMLDPQRASVYKDVHQDPGNWGWC